MKYKIVEIFESMQGEGRNTGKRFVFIRFAGCNLRCEWCDTDIAPRFELTAAQILDELRQYEVRRVILTGGEPTIQPGIEELVALLKKEGYYIAVETNGTNEPGWLAFVDYIACSPKCEYPGRLELNAADEVRVVASSENVVAFCREVQRKIAAKDYYVSPCEREGKIDFGAAKSALAELGEDWGLSVQLHKLLGFR